MPARDQRIDPDEVWRYCVSLYQPRASEWIRRQDEEGVDVMLHLFMDYAREHHAFEWSAHDLAEVEALVQPWRERSVLPIRALRRAMKGASAPGAEGAQAAEQVRQMLVQAELASERVELNALCEWLRHRIE